MTAENLSAANSRIRDVDVALETSNMTSLQILQQAGVSILAQANVDLAAGPAAAAGVAARPRRRRVPEPATVRTTAGGRRPFQ